MEVEIGDRLAGHFLCELVDVAAHHADIHQLTVGQLVELARSLQTPLARNP